MKKKSKKKSSLIDLVEYGMQIANLTFNEDPTSPEKLNDFALRQWKNIYGVRPRVVHEAWKRIKSSAQKCNGRLCHLFWTLKVLKTGGCQEDVASSLGTTSKTLRKWFWTYIELMSILVGDVVQWKNRNCNCAEGYKWKISVDGTDFEVQEPIPFDKKWYSHKFNGPGLRYEIALSVFSDNVVWYSGAHACGAMPDLKIFRECGLKTLLTLANEKCVADGTYKDGTISSKYNGNHEWKKAKSRMRARHESVNRRIKTFAMLRKKFPFDLDKHHLVFESALFLTQISLKYEPLMDSF